MIKSIDNETFRRFLRSNQAQKKQVSINLKGDHYGYYNEKDKLIGVISITDTINTRRIKGFLVNDSYQSNGVGTELLKHVMVDYKDMTAFATIHSYPLFAKNGFEIVSENANNIKFVKKTSKGKRTMQITDEEIEKVRLQLSELAKSILTLEDSRQKIVVDYIYKKLKELIK